MLNLPSIASSLKIAVNSLIPFMHIPVISDKMGITGNLIYCVIFVVVFREQVEFGFDIGKNIE